MHMPRISCSAQEKSTAFRILSLCLIVIAVAFLPHSARANEQTTLRDGWAIQSSAKVSATGEQISRAGFDSSVWYETAAPKTVFAALVENGVYPDPYFGMNLRSVPGVKYKIGSEFSNQEIPEDSPYAKPWWYRTEFTLPANAAGKKVWLHFDGINYRANIWVNGQKIADAQQVMGTFREFEFEVGASVHAGERNALAVEVFAPKKTDLAITWVDWNPSPPDKNLGIWKDVHLTATGEVSLRHPLVISPLDETFKTAALTISAELRNTSQQAVKGILRAHVDDFDIRQSVELGPGEMKVVSFAPEKFPRLKLEHPRLWWPYQMGTPNLYTAELAFESDGGVSDQARVTFGIRKVTSEHTPQGGLLFRVNGKRVLIRGGGWSSDMLLRWSPDRLDAELRLTKDMGLNTIRLEGKLEREEFFDWADRMGLLIMPGWCCCDMWEHWKQWTPEHYKIAGASLEDQIYRLRNHPSALVWLYGSDNPPPADVEEMYLKILRDKHWPNPAISSASATPTKITGPSGVKMTGPYEYVPPAYWLTDKEAGGAHGFNTETSPGPAIPTIENLKLFLPADHLWPIDEYWNYHAGGGRFMNVNIFTDGLTQRYGKAADLNDYLRKAQAITYDGQRAMFEAYARNKYDSTGVIQWMLNNAWPSLIWHLYDYYLAPAGGYFGTKKACEILHVQYSYDDHSVAVVNGTYEPQPGMKVTAKLYNLDAEEKASKETTLDLAADSTTTAFALPQADGLKMTYFLRLQLHDGSGKLVSDNFYWLSKKPDEMNWACRKDTAYTPQKSFADFTDLNKLPAVSVTGGAAEPKTEGDLGRIRVVVENPGKSVAFMVHLRLRKGTNGEDVAPVFWDDNYFSLLPGEIRELDVTYRTSDLHGASPAVAVDGWNVTPASIP